MPGGNRTVTNSPWIRTAHGVGISQFTSEARTFICFLPAAIGGDAGLLAGRKERIAATTLLPAGGAGAPATATVEAGTGATVATSEVVAGTPLASSVKE